MQRTLQRTKSTAGTGPDAPLPPAGDNVLRQAAAFRKVAQAAYENCRKGAQAEQEMHGRRNRPAQ
ncbi:MAG: hypothetical protein AB7Q45_05425 [Planctomycetaceae bacterium]